MATGLTTLKNTIVLQNEIPRQNQKVYTTLVEINTTTGLPTGRRKINDPSDPDYIAPE